MVSKKIKKLTALALTGAVVTGTLCSTNVFADEPSTEVIVSENFESDTHGFTARQDQSTVSIVKDGTAHDGDGYLVCSDRTKSWHGPQFKVDDVLTAGTEYIVSAWVKTPWYSNVTMSMEYTDSSGTAHYSNLLSAVSQGDWVEISDVKFTVPKNATGIYIYFETSDANVDISVDDFVITSAPVYDIQQDIPSLKDVYSPYFKLGGAIMSSEISNPSTVDLIKKHYNSITFGNELKPDAVLDKEACLAMAAEGDDTNPQVTLNAARELLDFCRENKLPVRGHVLVWHSQTPDWFFKENYADDGEFVTQEVMLKRMENYIKNVMEIIEKEYPDVEFYAWDVVNEIWLDDGNPRKPGTQAENPNYSGWVKIFGDNSFVDYAFEYARKYAPEGCKLYYNDFNEYMPSKTDAMIEMCTRLKEKGIIDGIGLQSHLDVSFPSVSAYEKALKKFCETGLDIQITELDATTADTSETGFETQAQYYSDIMDLAVKYSDSISAVVIWGTTDDKSWRAAKCPVLFNEDYTAKPCFYSIVDGLEENPEVTTPAETTEPDVTTTRETTSVVIDDVDLYTFNSIIKEIKENSLVLEVVESANTGLESGSEIEIAIPEEQKEYVQTLGVGDKIIIGYFDLEDVKGSILWVDLLEKAETTETETDTTTTVEDTEVPDETSNFGEPTLLGDADLNGTVDLLDLTVLNQHIVKISMLDTAGCANADVISDGIISINDLTQLKKYLIKMIDKF